MGYITNVQLNKRKKRVSIYIDHAFSFSVNSEIAVYAGLRVGEELPPAKIEELKRKRANAMNTLEDIKGGINKLDGATEVLAYLLHNHINPEG